MCVFAGVVSVFADPAEAASLAAANASLIACTAFLSVLSVPSVLVSEPSILALSHSRSDSNRRFPLAVPSFGEILSDLRECPDRRCNFGPRGEAFGGSVVRRASRVYLPRAARGLLAFLAFT